MAQTRKINCFNAFALLGQFPPSDKNPINPVAKTAKTNDRNSNAKLKQIFSRQSEIENKRKIIITIILNSARTIRLINHCLLPQHNCDNPLAHIQIHVVLNCDRDHDK